MNCYPLQVPPIRVHVAAFALAAAVLVLVAATQHTDPRLERGRVLAQRSPVVAELTGRKDFTDEQAVRLLMTGTVSPGPTAPGTVSAPPFNRADAEAVVAYLRSVKSKS